MNNPIETHECGKLWTKFRVPSIGSIIHVGSSVRSHEPPRISFKKRDEDLHLRYLVTCRYAFFSNELMAGKIISQLRHEQGFNLLVSFSDEIDFA